MDPIWMPNTALDELGKTAMAVGCRTRSPAPNESCDANSTQGDAAEMKTVR